MTYKWSTFHTVPVSVFMSVKHFVKHYKTIQRVEHLIKFVECCCLIQYQPLLDHLLYYAFDHIHDVSLSLLPSSW